jgi:multiple sugar transport system permease protein
MSTDVKSAMGSPGPDKAPGKPGKNFALRWLALNEKTRFSLLLLAPSGIMLILFQIVPILIGANASFRDWSLYDPQRTWVGLQHYIYILTDPNFLYLVLPNTLLLMVSSVSIGLVLGLALAHMLNKHFFGHAIVQTVILLPLMVAPVIASMMMRWIFNDQFGVVAAVIDALGFGQIAWLSDRWPSFAIIVFTDVWLWTPWFTILLLAGLRSLPKEPYEAAAIDAASKWRVFTHVTLPMMRPIMAVCIVIRSIDCFRTFDQVWVISGGGPARQTEVFSIYAYTEAFVYLNFGRGTAAAIIGAIIIGTLGWGLYKLLNRFMEVSR